MAGTPPRDRFEAKARKALADHAAKLDMEEALASKSGMSDQEIRARALECVCTLMTIPGAYKKVSAGNFWEDVHMFEAYIRDGVT